MSSPVTYLYLFNCVVLIVTATVIVVGAPGQPSKPFHALAAGLAAVWAICDLLSNLAQTAGQLEGLVRVAVWAWSPLPALVLLTVVVYGWGTERLRSPLLWVAVAAPIFSCLVLVYSGNIHQGYLPAEVNGGFFLRVPTRWQPLITVYFLIDASVAAALLIVLARRTGDPLHRRAARVFLWGFVPTAALGGVLNGGLAQLGMTLPFLGSVFAGGLVVMTAAAVLRFGFLEPIREAERERDEVQARLGEREVLLSALLFAVAIESLETRQLLFTNDPFERLAEGLGRERLIEALRERLDPLGPGEPLTGAELVLTQEEGATTLSFDAVVLDYGEAGPCWLLSLRDISARRLLEARLERAQRLESLGTLAGGVAHDMNNVLASILLTAEVAGDEVPEESVVADYLIDIVASCKRGRDTTRNLLGYARGGKYRQERLRLDRLAGEVCDVLSRTLPEHIEVVVEEPTTPLPLVMGDPSQLSHLLMNICLNSVDAMSQPGALTIAVAPLELGSADQRRFPELEPGPYLALSVRDEGCGMDEETRRRCLEPLFSTKPPGRGTGLGLSMVYGTARSHGGDLVVESILGEGTTVTVLLPAIAASDEAGRDAEPSGDAGGGEASVPVIRKALFVDDDELVRESGKRLFHRLGVEVLLAESGLEAVEVIRDQTETIDLVIMDMRMPKLDGPATFRAMRELAPSLKVLIASGYSRDEAVEELLAEGAIGFVEKPYDHRELIEMIGSHLELPPRPPDASE